MDFKIAWKTRHGHSEILEPSLSCAASMVKQLKERGAASIQVLCGEDEIRLNDLAVLAKREAVHLLRSNRDAANRRLQRLRR